MLGFISVSFLPVLATGMLVQRNGSVTEKHSTDAQFLFRQNHILEVHYISDDRVLRYSANEHVSPPLSVNSV